MTIQSAKIKRVMLKLSGEMLGGSEGQGVKGEALEMAASEIADLHAMGLQVAVVVGGGNIFRGSVAAKWNMDRTSADYMGMLATVINGLALQNFLEAKFQIFTRVLSAIHMQELCEPYIRRKAIKHLEKKRVIIFTGGTGNPYFTTDTAASLRARETNCDIIMKATKVDGVYDADPHLHPKAKKFSSLTYLDAISRKLNVMDATALTMCMEANLPILVFKLGTPGSVKHALQNPSVGTLVQ